LSVDNKNQLWRHHFVQIAALDGWYARAKIAVYAKGQGVGGHLSWQQTLNDYEIDFVGPLGIGLMRIIGNDTMTSLQIPDKPLYKGHSPEQLIQRHTGYQLPVSQLYYWARGIPNPKLPFVKQLNRSGQLQQLTQMGWNIEYLAYNNQASLTLPSKIVMTKDSFKIKLVRLSWQATHSSAHSFDL